MLLYNECGRCGTGQVAFQADSCIHFKGTSLPVYDLISKTCRSITCSHTRETLGFPARIGNHDFYFCSSHRVARCTDKQTDRHFSAVCKYLAGGRAGNCNLQLLLNWGRGSAAKRVNGILGLDKAVTVQVISSSGTQVLRRCSQCFADLYIGQFRECAPNQGCNR